MLVCLVRVGTRAGTPMLIITSDALSNITSSALLGMYRAWWPVYLNVILEQFSPILTPWFVPSHGVIGLAVCFDAVYSIHELEYNKI